MTRAVRPDDTALTKIFISLLGRVRRAFGAAGGLDRLRQPHRALEPSRYRQDTQARQDQFQPDEQVGEQGRGVGRPIRRGPPPQRVEVGGTDQFPCRLRADVVPDLAGPLPLLDDDRELGCQRPLLQDGAAPLTQARV